MIRLLLLLLAGSLAASTGCRNGPCCRNPDRRPGTRIGGDPNPNALGDPIPPRGAVESIPPTGIPPTPEPLRRNFDPEWNPPAPREARYPPSYSQRGLLPGPAPGVLGEPVMPAERAKPILIPEAPLEVPAQPKLLTPVPLPHEIPDGKEPAAVVEPKREAARNDLPPTVEKEKPAEKPREKSSPDLPGFAQVPLDKGQVSTSRKPLTDGFAWLKANGYKTVAYLHEPDAKDVGAARELAEKQGLKFVPISVSPETLPAAYKAFAELLKDSAARPLHAFATSGNRAGALWYLAFRDLELLDNDAARVRAAKLGFEAADASDEAKRFWLAVQEFLSKR